MVLGFGDPTEGMKKIWSHFVILDVCECVILRPQIMLKLPLEESSKIDKKSYLKLGRQARVGNVCGIYYYFPHIFIQYT